MNNQFAAFLKKIKILFVEDHPVTIKGFTYMLNQVDRFELLGVAQNGVQALELLETLFPDIVITDLSMPVMSGFDLIPKLSSKFPKIRTIVFSQYFEEGIIAEMLKQGARGYLSKACDFDEMKLTIEKVYSDGFYFNESGTFRIISNLLNKTQALTAREKEILLLICEGNSNKKIALILHISEETVDTHRKAIYKKTGSKSIVDIVKYAIRNGFASA